MAFATKASSSMYALGWEGDKLSGPSPIFGKRELSDIEL